MHKKLTTTLLTLTVGVLPLTGHAGLSDKEKALWGMSANAPTTFALPAGRDADVMAKAQSLIGQWATLDRYMYAMPILTRTPTLIKTEDPTVLNEVGFKVLDTPTASGSVITIDVSAFEGKILQVGQQRHDADKRAHLLAYLLEQYAGVQPASPPLFAPAPVTSPLPPVSAQPVVPPVTLLTPVPGAPTPSAAFDPDLQQLRSQLDAGQYDAALKTLDGLRAAVVSHTKTAP